MVRNCRWTERVMSAELGAESQAAQPQAAQPQRVERVDERADERVVVVGGTSGIGLAVAERQLGRGKEAVVTGWDPGRLSAALKQLEQVGKGASGESAGARDEAAMHAFFGRLGAVDHVVVTVTGASAAGPFRWIGVSDLRGPRRASSSRTRSRRSPPSRCCAPVVPSPSSRRARRARRAWRAWPVRPYRARRDSRPSMPR